MIPESPLNPAVNNPSSPSPPQDDGAICDRVQLPEATPSRFESKPSDFVGIAGPTLVYIGVARREDFDKIAVPCVDNGLTEQGHVLTKTIGRFQAKEVTVVFQHWLKQKTLQAMIADMEAKRK